MIHAVKRDLFYKHFVNLHTTVGLFYVMQIHEYHGNS